MRLTGKVFATQLRSPEGNSILALKNLIFKAIKEMDRIMCEPLKCLTVQTILLMDRFFTEKVIGFPATNALFKSVVVILYRDWCMVTVFDAL